METIKLESPVIMAQEISKRAVIKAGEQFVNMYGILIEKTINTKKIAIKKKNGSHA
jgi:hypothetical protein